MSKPYATPFDETTLTRYERLFLLVVLGIALGVMLLMALVLSGV